MNKPILTKFLFQVLASMTTLVLGSCGIISTINRPVQSPTPAPPYIHYLPPEGFNVHLEFDYPSSWVFSEEKQPADFIAIWLGDPRFRTLPTPPPDGLNRTPNDFGLISIWILPSKPGQTPDTILEALKKDYSETSWMTVLNDYKITIDGYDASVLEYQIHPSEGYPSLMFDRRIIFMFKGQKYEILFEIAEKDRGSEFEKGYEYFFKSLKIVP